MSKIDKAQTVMNWIAGAAGLYFVSIAIAGAVKRKRENGVGKAERVKRRVYKEVSLAQDAGVDFSKRYDELTKDEKKSLQKIGRDLGWKQSKRAIENGKPYIESYYNSLRRAWNAVSGVAGIGRAYDVKDANGNVCLTWIEDAAAHVERETEPIAPVAPKAKRQGKDEKEEERRKFAKKYLQNFLEQHPDQKQYLTEPFNEQDGSRADIILRDFISGNIKFKKSKGYYTPIDYKIYIQGKWYDNYTMSNKTLWAFVFGLMNSWDQRKWENADYDELRKDLLDRAKHMQVVIEDGDGLGRYDKDFVTGDERYNHLDKINYLVVMSMRYEQGGSVYYPVRSYPDEASAMAFSKIKGGTRVIPIYDMKVDQITGVQ